MEVWNTGECVIDFWPASNLNLFCILYIQILEMHVNKVNEHKVLKAVHCKCLHISLPLHKLRLIEWWDYFFPPIAGPPSSPTLWAYITKCTYEQHGM